MDKISDFDPSFELPQGANASAAVLLQLFLPDHLLDKWVQCTNDYANSILPVGRRKPVTKSEILKFLATISYMGICRFPSKEDYWPGDKSNILPTHPLICLTKTRFQYIWHFFHTIYKPGAPEEWIDQVNRVSQKLCKHPGWIFSIDEMLWKFMGQSAEKSA